MRLCANSRASHETLGGVMPAMYLVFAQAIRWTRLRTLNKAAGGQGGEFKRLCAQAAKQERDEANGATRKAREVTRKAAAYSSQSWPSRLGRCEHPRCSKFAIGATGLTCA